MRVGIIVRGNHGKSTAKQMAKYFEVVTFELPANLPELIEEPIEFPDDVLDVDVLISYASHSDINLELVKVAKAKLLIITGKGGSRVQLKDEAEKHGRRVLIIDICCVAPTLSDEDVSEFFRYFGKPEFEVEIEDGKLKSVKVLRCAFCGATDFVAEMLRGASVEEAPARAGYLTQIFPCLASRGIDGKIHLAAEMHKKAMERAIEKALKEKHRI